MKVHAEQDAIPERDALRETLRVAIAGAIATGCHVCVPARVLARLLNRVEDLERRLGLGANQ